MTSYTDEQVLECAATYEGYGEPACPAILRSLLADRTRLQAEVEALREVEEAAQAACVWLRKPPKPMHDMYRGNGRDSYASEAMKLAKAIDSALAKKGDV